MDVDPAPDDVAKKNDGHRPQTLARTSRRARLLDAAIQVSRNISSILDPEDLLRRTVDIICNAYGFYYAGIFLIETFADGQAWAVLKAGRGEAGRKLIEKDHKLRVGGQSMIGACTALNEARLALDVGNEAVWFNNPFLSDTRSEMALPLALGDEVIGALTVQSTEAAAFSDEDVASLQAMADQLAVAINNARLHRQNSELFRQASRRAVLLQAGAEVSRNITSILDLDVLLASTVYIICEEYGFCYAGIFLVESDEGGNQWAVLKAGRGEIGRKMVEEGYRLAVGGNSIVGDAIQMMEARIALDVDELRLRYSNPLLTNIRSEMVLPLIILDNCIGALTVQSKAEAAFSEEDISSLQMMADQLAVAIKNARLLKDLEKANEELVRTKTFETIATATSETIHWVGNKAAPIPACIARLREDISRFIAVANELVLEAGPPLQHTPLAQLVLQNHNRLQQNHPHLKIQAHWLKDKPPPKLQRLLNIESMLEDLEIIENSADTILRIKEDLIGPARHQDRQKADIVKTVKENINAFGLPADLVSYSIDGVIPPVFIDPVQLGRVITNLIKNAVEAMDHQPQPHIFIAIRKINDRYVLVDIADNGSGIPEQELTKIWLTFHTSKADRGGTGLGLPACLQSMERMGGKISVVSEVGVGSTFTLHVPIYRPGEHNSSAE